MVESIDELRKICQGTDEFPWPERKVSIYITKLLLKTHITANQVTLLDLLLGLTGAAFLFLGNPWYAFIGAFFLELFSIFDCVDGEVARYRKSSTTFSEFFQDLPHPLVHPLTFIGLSFGLYETLGNILVFALAFSAILATFLNPHINLVRERLLPNWDHVRTFRIIQNNVKKHMGLGSFLTNLIAFLFQDLGVIFMLNLCAGADWLKLVLLSYRISSPLLQINFKYLFLLLYGITLPILGVINVFVSLRILKQVH